MKLSIIDGDSILYILGWLKKGLDPDDYQQVIAAVDNYMESMITATQAEFILGFMGSSQPTFRSLSDGIGNVLDIKMKDYKGNRGIVKPEWFLKSGYLIRHRLVTKYGFSTVDFIEADDAVIISAEHYKDQYDVTICSCDKDLRQYPGKHYDYQKEEPAYITVAEARYNFWTQMITGDSTDNVEGIPGMGPKGAEKALKDKLSSFHRNTVLTLYQTKFGEREGLMRFAMTFNHLYILRKPGYNFDLSKLSPKSVRYILDPEGEPEKVDINKVFDNNE